MSWRYLKEEHLHCGRLAASLGRGSIFLRAYQFPLPRERPHRDSGTFESFTRRSGSGTAAGGSGGAWGVEVTSSFSLTLHQIIYNQVRQKVISSHNIRPRILPSHFPLHYKTYSKTIPYFVSHFYGWRFVLLLAELRRVDWRFALSLLGWGKKPKDLLQGGAGILQWPDFPCASVQPKRNTEKLHLASAHARYHH